MKVHVKAQFDSWILDQMATKLEVLDYVTRSDRVNHSADLNYFINYVQFEVVETRSAAFFTHLETETVESSTFWWTTAQTVDLCIFHSRMYMDITREKIHDKQMYVVSPGIDVVAFQPRPIRIGVVGRTYGSGRKGEDLLQQVVSRVPGIEWRITGSGWGVESMYVEPDDMPKFYQECDYILVTSRYEGGPMSVLEAVACGVEVIAPPVGWVTEFPHIPYPVGDVDALCNVLLRLQTTRNVFHEYAKQRSWDQYVARHDQVFRSILL